MTRLPGKIGGLLWLCVAATTTDASAGWGRRQGAAQPASQPRSTSVLGQAVRIAPRVPGVPGIPGMSIKGMPRIPGMPGLPGVGSIPGLIGKLR